MRDPGEIARFHDRCSDLMRELLEEPEKRDEAHAADRLGTRLEVSRRLRTDPDFRARWAERSEQLTTATRQRLQRQREAGGLGADLDARSDRGGRRDVIDPNDLLIAAQDDVRPVARDSAASAGPFAVAAASADPLPFVLYESNATRGSSPPCARHTSGVCGWRRCAPVPSCWQRPDSSTVRPRLVGSPASTTRDPESSAAGSRPPKIGACGPEV